MLKRPTRDLYKVRLICILNWWSLKGHCYVDEVLPLHVLQIYQTVGNSFLFQQDNASIPTIWQGLFASWSCHTPLTGVPGPDPSPIGHPLDILGQRVHDHTPFQLPHFPKLNTTWLRTMAMYSTRGWGRNPRLLLNMLKRLIDYINKVGGNTRYDIQYINL